MPTSDSGKAISRRNATTHGVFARDIVLPALGEDPEGYAQLQAEWTKQLVPRNLLEQHYVEKIATASWRLRRLHRWQAQLFEDPTLTEAERLERLNAVLRHETALQRQLYARRQAARQRCSPALRPSPARSSPGRPAYHRARMPRRAGDRPRRVPGNQ